MVVNFSTLSYPMIGNSLAAIAGLMGVAVGLSGFSGKDAFRNVLGDTNYIVFSSHTLPVSKRKLYIEFFIKDTFFYMFLIIIPLSLGFLIPTGFAILPSLLDAAALFTLGLMSSALVALSSLTLPSLNVVNYGNIDVLDPVADKSVVDIFRSSGGFLKILFSLGVLSFFYWIMVLNFPLASIFLENPLLSFSILIGLINLSIYNWLNKFDSLETYSYIPLDSLSISTLQTDSLPFPGVTGVVCNGSGINPCLPRTYPALTGYRSLDNRLRNGCSCQSTGIKPERKPFPRRYLPEVHSRNGSGYSSFALHVDNLQREIPIPCTGGVWAGADGGIICPPQDTEGRAQLDETGYQNVEKSPWIASSVMLGLSSSFLTTSLTSSSDACDRTSTD